MKVIVYEDAVGLWRWRLISGSRIVADSGQGYVGKAGALRACARMSNAIARNVAARFKNPEVVE